MKHLLVWESREGEGNQTGHTISNQKISAVTNFNDRNYCTPNKIKMINSWSKFRVTERIPTGNIAERYGIRAAQEERTAEGIYWALRCAAIPQPPVPPLIRKTKTDCMERRKKSVNDHVRSNQTAPEQREGVFSGRNSASVIQQHFKLRTQNMCCEVDPIKYQIMILPWST